MNYLYNYKVRKNIMGLLLILVILFGTYAAFADAIKDTLGQESNNLWIEIAPFSGYIALGAIILYILLNILDKRLYEKALIENKEQSKS